MKFGLDITVRQSDGSIPLTDLTKNLELAKKALGQPSGLEGAIVPVAGGKPAMEPVDDPLLPLLEQWMLKVPWLLQGDTETVFLKNTEHAFGFEVVNESVALSFYVGQGNEVDQYIMEPVPVPLDQFCDVSIGVVRALLTTLDKVDNRFRHDVSDVRQLQEATVEAEKALKEYRLDRR